MFNVLTILQMFSCVIMFRYILTS